MSARWKEKSKYAVACLLASLAVPRTPLLAQAESRIFVTVAAEDEVEVHEVLAFGDRESAPLAPPAKYPSEFLQTTLWAYDDEDAIAWDAAIGHVTRWPTVVSVWGAWRLNGSRLSAHPIFGDGTPDFEFPASDPDAWPGVASARGADRTLFFERDLFAGDEHRVHAFTFLAQDGNPDWSFEFPTVDSGGWFGSRQLAVSRDGSIAAATFFADWPNGPSTLYVFDANIGNVLLEWTDETLMKGVDLTDDGSIALITSSDYVVLIDTVTGEELFRVDEWSGTSAVHQQISGDGSVFFVTSGFELHVYRRSEDGTSYERVIDFDPPDPFFGFGWATAISRDGSTVGAFAHDLEDNAFLRGEVFLFDVASGVLLGSHPVSGSGSLQGSAWDAASSDDGSVMAFASWGTEFQDWPEIMVFNRDVELIGQIEFPGSAFGVDVSTDGRYVVGAAKAVHANTLGHGGRIELIELQPGDNPIPVLTELDHPKWATGGQLPVTLTVRGSGFREESVLRFGGTDRPTTFIDTRTLTARIPASDLDAVGVFPVTVFSPMPGGGTSQPLEFEVLRGNPTKR